MYVASLALPPKRNRKARAPPVRGFFSVGMGIGAVVIFPSCRSTVAVLMVKVKLRAAASLELSEVGRESRRPYNR